MKTLLGIVGFALTPIGTLAYLYSGFGADQPDRGLEAFAVVIALGGAALSARRFGVLNTVGVFGAEVAALGAFNYAVEDSFKKESLQLAAVGTGIAAVGFNKQIQRVIG